jgi:plastocyanin
MKSLKLFKPALVTTLGIAFAWLLSLQPAEAGYTVTLQQVGANVVATGSGAIDLTGLTFIGSSGSDNPGIDGPSGLIGTGPFGSLVDAYQGFTGPTSFGIGPGGRSPNTASGDFVSMSGDGQQLFVPHNYVSGAALSDSMTFNNATLATLGVTPGTYVWTWGTRANQNFTLKIFSTGQAATFVVSVVFNPFHNHAQFSPSSVTINPGDHVEWTWATSGHSTTSGLPGMPNGLWDSGVRNFGATFTHTFNSVGTFPYHCTQHGEGGQVIVIAAPTPTPTPLTGPPTVTTNPAALIASFSARLKGSLNPDGLSTTFHFQYGTTTSYGLTTAPQTQTGDTSRLVVANINGLTPQTIYHFRIVASNTAGTTFGSDRTFTTLTMTGFPVVKTNPATNLTASSARLEGLLDPHGLTTSVHFQYGRGPNYGGRTPNETKTGNNYQNISATISGLSAHTTYHFRIVATNSVGTRYGGDGTFTTQ